MQFGALFAPAQGQATASVLARLSKIGADRNAKDAALASLAAPGFKTMEESGDVVAGVNDAPAEASRSEMTTRRKRAQEGHRLRSAVAGHARRSESARSQIGTATLVSNVAIDSAGAAPAQAASPGTASGRPRIYDASEGTPLDPLLNKTYDLSYAKVVPADALRK